MAAAAVSGGKGTQLPPSARRAGRPGASAAADRARAAPAAASAPRDPSSRQRPRRSGRDLAPGGARLGFYIAASSSWYLSTFYENFIAVIKSLVDFLKSLRLKTLLGGKMGLIQDS
ncbi:unnamed protein product [Eretmochelys imbricata]